MALLVLSFPVSPSMGRKKCSKACASSQGWAKGQPCPQGTGRALPAPLRGLALKGRPSAVPGPREPSTCFCPPCQRQEALRAQRPPVWGSAELVPGLEGRAEHSAAQGGNAASARSPRTRLSHAGPPPGRAAWKASGYPHPFWACVHQNRKQRLSQILRVPVHGGVAHRGSTGEATPTSAKGRMWPTRAAD